MNQWLNKWNCIKQCWISLQKEALRGVEPTTLRLRVSRSTDWASKAGYEDGALLNINIPFTLRYLQFWISIPCSQIRSCSRVPSFRRQFPHLHLLGLLPACLLHCQVASSVSTLSALLHRLVSPVAAWIWGWFWGSSTFIEPVKSVLKTETTSYVSNTNVPNAILTNSLMLGFSIGPFCSPPLCHWTVRTCLLAPLFGNSPFTTALEYFCPLLVDPWWGAGFRTSDRPCCSLAAKYERRPIVLFRRVAVRAVVLSPSRSLLCANFPKLPPLESSKLPFKLKSINLTWFLLSSNYHRINLLITFIN